MCDDRNKILELLYAECYDSVFRYCLAVADFNPRYYSLIEDCIQDAFIKTITHYKEFKGYQNKTGWIARVASNRLKEEIRKEQNHQKVISAHIEDMGQSMAFSINEIEKKIDTNENRDEILRIYRMLSERERRVFVSFFLEEKRIKEVAADSNLSLNSVRAAIKRIRNKARLEIFVFFILIKGAFFDFHTL
ncbi:RNA polymerase sigma factor [Faecalimonas sp.]